MTMLIIDTSRKEGFVSLSKSGELLVHSMCISKEFLPHAALLVKESKEPLVAIAVGIGPGSYTGTRAGATFAKTLAFAKNIPVIGFYSPLAYLPTETCTFAASLPGKRGDTCLITGKKTVGTILEHSDPMMIPEDEIKAALEPFAHKVESASAPLNLTLLLTYLQSRLETKDFDSKGEVDIAYLYDIPAPQVH